MANEFKGLAAIRAMQEEQKRLAAMRERPKADYFKFPLNVDEVTVRFIQEMDEGATGYSEAQGLGLIKVEHQAPGPDGFKRRANCTLEEGACYACERHAMKVKEEEGGWRQRRNFYINALVKIGNAEPKVLVLSRSGNASFTNSVIEEAVDEGTITAVNYRIKKTGSGTSTNWMLKGLTKETPFSLEGAQAFDLETTVLRSISYEDQPAYYGAVYSGGLTASEPSQNEGLSRGGGNDDQDAAW